MLNRREARDTFSNFNSTLTLRRHPIEAQVLPSGPSPNDYGLSSPPFSCIQASRIEFVVPPVIQVLAASKNRITSLRDLPHLPAIEVRMDFESHLASSIHCFCLCNKATSYSEWFVPFNRGALKNESFNGIYE